MYAYYNNQGVLTTSIPHGEPVRQGNSLNLYVCFSVDYFFQKDESYENWTATATSVLPDGSIGVPNKATLTTSQDVIQTFYKTSDSEVTYDLDGETPYLIYHFKFNPEQATNIPGKIKIVITLLKPGYSDQIILSPIIVHVEKTLAGQGQNNSFLVKISEMINELSTSKVDQEDLQYLTTAPTADNTTGILKFVVLETEPTTKYSGYVYFILEEEEE